MPWCTSCGNAGSRLIRNMRSRYTTTASSWGSSSRISWWRRQVIIELKAAKDDNEIFVAQCLNYLKATGLPICLLLQFRQAPPRNQTLTRIISASQP